MKYLSILGSTGSIGQSTLKVVREHPDKFKVMALAAGHNIKEIISQVKEFRPRYISVATKEGAQEVASIVGSGAVISYGEESLLEAAAHPDVTYVVSAISGSAGLMPTLAAIKANKDIGLANKECLVAAGHILTTEACKHNVTILPIDSEHSAIFQCLNGEGSNKTSCVRKIILTASGGSFRNKDRKELKNVTIEQALAHPNWSMGSKITIDCATMLNKGLEVIEAHWLFGLPYSKIEVILHPQSIVHSLVDFIDGSCLAHLGVADMKIPILYALSYPDRLPLELPALDLTSLCSLTFKKMDFTRYPMLKFAYIAGRTGGTLPAVLNAANEVAVQLFLRKQIPFLAIEELVERALEAHLVVHNPMLSDILEAQSWSKDFVNKSLAITNI